MFRNVPKFSEMFRNVPKCSEMFRNAPKCSETHENPKFRNVPKCSEIPKQVRFWPVLPNTGQNLTGFCSEIPKIVQTGLACFWLSFRSISGSIWELVNILITSSESWRIVCNTLGVWEHFLRAYRLWQCSWGSVGGWRGNHPYSITAHCHHTTVLTAILLHCSLPSYYIAV